MRLDGEQFQQFQDALISAFPKQSDLDHMVRVQFSLNPSTILPVGTLKETTAELISWAEAEGRLEELVAKAVAAVPGNRDLDTFVLSFQAQLAAIRPAQDSRMAARAAVLEQLTQDFSVDFVAKTRRLRPLGRRALAGLFNSGRIFGGRERELGKLDSFIDSAQSGYFFVTGPTGFGKTTLLTHWVQALANRQIDTSYHFVTPDVDAGERFCLENLCTQILIYHGMGGELPASERELRLLYALLLRLPPVSSGRLVVIIEGLEEALAYWRPRQPGPDMFPADLAEGVQVIFAGATIADKDWPDDLGLTLPSERMVELGPLTLPEVKKIVEVARPLPAGEQTSDMVAERLFELSGGDPFYLQELMAQGLTDPQQLKRPPVGLDSYLKEWWRESAKPDPSGFADLMGLLAIARAPLLRQEIIDIGTADAVRGANFDLLVGQASRYVTGSEVKGYRLSHSRIREFVYDRLADAIGGYQNSLADYCLRWNEPQLPEHARTYMLLNATTHLAEAGRWQDLQQLLGPDWLGAKVRQFALYSSFIRDLNIAAETGLGQTPPAYTSVAAYAIARQTVREIVLNLPTELLVVWIHMDKVDSVQALLEAMGAVKGRAVEPMIVVANELLTINRERQGVEGQNAAIAGADLLSRALSMLSLERASKLQLKKLRSIAACLEPGKGLSDLQAGALLEQAENWTQDLRETDLRATASAVLASAAAGWPERQTQCRRLIAQAQAAMAQLDNRPDWLLATAYLLPALRTQQSGTVLGNVQSMLSPAANLFESAALEKDIVSVLIATWRPDQEADQAAAAALVKDLGQLCLEHGDGFQAAAVASALARLGQGAEAIYYVRYVWNREPFEGAYTAIHAAQALYAADAQSVVTMLGEAEQFANQAKFGISVNRELFRAALAQALVHVGRWERGLYWLAHVRPAERTDAICRCLRTLGETILLESSQRLTLVEQLAALSFEAGPEDQAQVHAVAAQTLLGTSPELAEKYAMLAQRLGMAELPEGDTDSLRMLMALALHEDGDTTGALAAVMPMQWGTNAADTLVRLIRATPAHNEDALAAYAQGLLHLLETTDRTSLFVDTLRESLAAVAALAEMLPNAAAVLCDYVYGCIRTLRSYDEMTTCAAEEAAARMRFDRDGGSGHFKTLIDWLANQLNAGVAVSEHSLGYLFSALANLPVSVAGSTPELLARARPLMDFYPQADAQIKLREAYAVALAASDPQSSIAFLQQNLTAIAHQGKERPSALHLTRMISDYRGRKVGTRSQQAQSVKSTGLAILRVAMAYSPDALKLLDELLQIIKAIDTQKDRAQALADLFDNCAQAPSDLQDALGSVYDAALAQSEALPADLADFVKQHAISCLSQVGDTYRAQAAKDTMNDLELRAQAEEDVERAQWRLTLGELTALEQAVLDKSHPILGRLVVEDGASDEKRTEILAEYGEIMTHDELTIERVRWLDDWMPPLSFALRVEGGSALMCDLIERIEESDYNLVQAAKP